MSIPKLAVKYARCAKCRHFYTLPHLTRLECPSCVYRTFRCKTCDGMDGARRSIRVHYAFFRARRGGDGGHRGKP